MKRQTAKNLAQSLADKQNRPIVVINNGRNGHGVMSLYLANELKLDLNMVYYPIK